MKKGLLLSIFILLVSMLPAQSYVLYGTTSYGGQSGHGVIFRFNPFTGYDTVLFNFDSSNGSGPFRGICFSPKGILYGTCEFGGSQNQGVLFSYNLLSNKESTLTEFTGPNGSMPGWDGFLYKNILYGTTGYGGTYQSGTIYSYNILTNNYSVLFSFNDSDGSVPYGGLLALNDSSFYGMAGNGGTYKNGVIYKFNPLNNEETVLYNFNGNVDGAYLQSTFIKDSNGLLYGMTQALGINGGGTLLNFNTSTNMEATLLAFDMTDGNSPFGDLLLASNKLLYGLTTEGGSDSAGVLFSYDVNTSNYSRVINFNGFNGANPDGGAVIEDTVNKILYGITEYGGTYNDGVIFSYNLKTKKDSVLFNFDGTHGANPQGTLLMVPDSLIGLGVGEVKGENAEVKVYPNPSNGVFNFQFLGDVSASLNIHNTVEIYNVLGEKVYNATLKQVQGDNTIDLSNQPNGVYLYRVITENGDLIREGKIVVGR